MNNFNLRKSLDFVFNAKLILFMFGMFLLLPNISIAAVNLPWSTTYNCADWMQSQTLNCDGLQTYGDWTTSAGNREQITTDGTGTTTDANYPGGGGGRGQRQWNGDGVNNNSGGTSITFTITEPELWFRWYMKYKQGFIWNNPSLAYDKLIYSVGSTVVDLESWDKFSISNTVNGVTYYGADGNGWDTIMVNGGTDANGHKTSDGQWHCYEWHIKSNGVGAQGIGEVWVDGVQRMSRNDIVHPVAGWSFFLIGSNQRHPGNVLTYGSEGYVDFDDIAISATGRIGCLGSDTTAPTQPTNLSATTQSTSQINLSWTASTDNIGVTGYRIYRCSGSGCVPSTQIATSATNSYSNTGLTANTTYVYRVAAYDAAGNVSAQSSSASAATQAVVDTTPPAAPTGLTVM